MPQYPIFAQSMRRSEAEFLRLGADWYLLEELEKTGEESCINQAWLSQPCCTAVQVALVDLLSSWGIQPDVVCGHSSGEIAAAYAAGALSAGEAITAAHHRGAVTSRQKRVGTMAAIGMSWAETEKYLVPNVTTDNPIWSKPGNATRHLVRLSLDGGHDVIWSADGTRLSWFLGAFW